MASYDLIERLTTTFRQIERELAELKSELSACRLLAGRVFELPEVTKEAEHEPLTTIQVKQHVGKRAAERALHHFSGRLTA